MDRGDALAVILEVWSGIGLLPGLVVFGTAMVLFGLLDWAIGDRIAGMGLNVWRLHGDPNRLQVGAGDSCGGSTGDSGGTDGDCRSAGF